MAVCVCVCVCNPLAEIRPDEGSPQEDTKELAEGSSTLHSFDYDRALETTLVLNRSFAPAGSEFRVVLKAQVRD